MKLDQAEIRDYLDRSGDDSFRWELPLMAFDEGWFNYWINEKTDELVVVQAYGNHKALLAESKNLCGVLKLKAIVFATYRNGRAMARLFGGERVAEIVRIDLWDQ